MTHLTAESWLFRDDQESCDEDDLFVVALEWQGNVKMMINHCFLSPAGTWVLQ